MSIGPIIAIVAEAVTIVAGLTAAGIFFGSISTKVQKLEDRQEKNDADHVRLTDVSFETQRKVAALEANTNSIKEIVLRMEEKLDRWAERG